MNKGVIFLLLFSFGCAQPRVYLKQDSIMGTYYKIKIYASRNPGYIFRKVSRELRRLEMKLSDYLPGSEISKINHLAGKGYVEVSPETLSLIKEALLISYKSNGAYEPTIRPLMEIWGFKERKRFPPDIKEITKALDLIGWKKVKLNSKAVKLEKEGMELDLGGIAKGYAVDRVVRLLRDEGVKNALVEIGGELYCLGKGVNPGGWVVGIQDPLNPDAIIAKMNLSNKAVATSGSYENFFIWRGKKYSHIIDPSTGFPVQNNLISVTIISSQCSKADAWATALFVLGWEKAQEIVESDSDLEAVLIKELPEGLGIWVSSGLRGKIKLYEKENIISQNCKGSG